MHDGSSSHFGADHHEEVFTPDVMLDLLPTLAEVIDEPFADASILPTYLLSRFTRRVRNGRARRRRRRRAPGGYPTFPADRVARVYRVPRVLHEHVVTRLTDRIPVSTSNFSVDFKIKQFVRGAAEPVETRHATWLGSFTARRAEAAARSRPG